MDAREEFQNLQHFKPSVNAKGWKTLREQDTLIQLWICKGISIAEMGA